MIVASGVSMQFGPQVLFSNVTVKFGGGNRYGLIGANGSGKSTFMKILGGELEPSAGSVSIDSSERVGRLRQDQFAYEGERVLDVVLQGHAGMWAAMRERDVARGRLEIATQDFHERRFAATVGADQAVAVAVAELDGYIFEQGPCPKLHGNVGSRYQSFRPKKWKSKNGD